MSNERAKAHAKHGYYCTCGKVVHGNGGRFNHAAMHRRRQRAPLPRILDAHHYVTREDYEDRRRRGVMR